METSKILRIVLASLCAVALLFIMALPIASFSFYSPTVGFFRLVGVTGNGVLVLFIILTFITILGLIGVGIICILFDYVDNRMVGVAGIATGSVFCVAFLLFIIYFIAEGGGALLSACTYIDLMLAIAILTISIILLVKYSKGSQRCVYSAYGYPQGRQAQGGGSAHIVGLSGVYQNASFDASDGRPIMFGRDTNTCSVVFDQFETAVSRQHCIVTFLPHANLYSVRDISKNGTYLGSMTNRMPTNVEQNVKRGTILYLGSNKNTFKLD